MLLLGGSYSQAGFDEGVAVGVDFLFAGKESAPDAGGGGEIGKGSAEGFDGEIAIIPTGFGDGDGFAGGAMVFAWGAAVVGRNVDVADDVEIVLQRREGVLFLDVGVEGVIHRSKVRMTDAMHVGFGLLHGVEEVGLKPVEGFDGEGDAGLLGVVREGPVDIGGVGEFGLRGEGTSEIAQHLVVGTAEEFDAGSVAAIDDFFQVIQGSLTVGGDGADGVVLFIRANGDGGGFEAIVLQGFTNFLEVAGVAVVEDGNLRAIVADGFEFGKERELRLNKVSRPEEEIEADFHGTPVMNGI